MEYSEDLIYDALTRKPLSEQEMDFTKGGFETVNEDGQNIKLWTWYEPEKQEELRKEAIRIQREPLFNAFNIYASMLAIGAITITDVDKTEVLIWYEALKAATDPGANLDCLKFVPAVVAYYLNENN